MRTLNDFIKSHKKFVVFMLTYVILRLVLININYTEWGDTFRMIRGAEYLSHGLWPWDEKRWPFYSLLLVPGIWMNSPVLWGRILSIILSVGSLSIIYFFYLKYISTNKKFALLAVIFTASSSVFAYWSFRVMADPLFAFLILLYSYTFLSEYTDNRPSGINRRKVFLSLILLMLTMTRLEGIFIAASSGLFFLLKRYWKDIFLYYIPQVLVFIPWTVYAKFLYKGPVQNDYLQEVQTFIFNYERFEYFLTYTLFILVLPVLSFFAIRSIKDFKKRKNQNFAFIVIYGFIALEILMGFIWTPSLPRIYMPIIPFLIIFAINNLEKVLGFSDRQLDSFKKVFILGNLILLVIFGYLQFNLRLYFLGASKILFAVLLITALDMSFIILLKRYFRKVIVWYLLAINILVSIIVIGNQRFEYKTVKEGIGYVNSRCESEWIGLPVGEGEACGRVAYSDETGNTEWYFRNTGFYLDQRKDISEADQYQLLKDNGVGYLLWTNEFNRGSSFYEPKDDSRYEIEVEFRQPIKGVLSGALDRFGIIKDTDYTVYVTKVYKIN